MRRRCGSDPNAIPKPGFKDVRFYARTRGGSTGQPRWLEPGDILGLIVDIGRAVPLTLPFSGSKVNVGQIPYSCEAKAFASAVQILIANEPQHVMRNLGNGRPIKACVR